MELSSFAVQLDSLFYYVNDIPFEEKGISIRVQNMVQLAAAHGEPMKSCFTYGSYNAAH